MDELTNGRSNASVLSIEEDEPLIASAKAKSSKCSLLLVVSLLGVAALAGVGVWYGVSSKADNGGSSNTLLRLQAESLHGFKTVTHTELSVKQRQNPDLRMEVAKDILRRVPLIDGHNDLPWQLRNLVDNEISKIDLRSDLTKRIRYSHTDIPRLRKGMLGAQFWSIYAVCSAQYKDAFQYAVEQIDLVKNMIIRYPDTFKYAGSVKDIIDAFGEGKIASMMGVEGGHMMGESLAALRQLYALGARYMTLTHNCNTPWADNSQPETDTKTMMHNGLTDWGKLVIAEMNRLGMLVDLAHVSSKVMTDVLDITKAPVIYSHSSAYAVCPHPRNVPDQVLLKVKENGGVVMVNFNPSFVNCTEENALAANSDGRPASLEQVADHLDHLRHVAGPEAVGIGSDFNGITNTPVGLEDVSKYPDLLSEMLRRGWSIEEVEGLAGRNLLRVFSQVEKVRDELSAELPIDTVIDYSTIPDTTCRSGPVN